MEAITNEQTISSPRTTEDEAPEIGLQEEYEEDNHPQDDEEEDSHSIIPPSIVLADDEEQDSADVETATTSTSVARRGSGRGRGRGRGSRGGAAGTSGSTRGRGASTGRGGGRGGRGGSSTRGAGGGSTAAKRGRGSNSTAIKSGRGGRGSKAAGGGGIGNNTSNSKDHQIGEIGGIGSGPSNTIFPLARISRIVKVDKEIEMTSKDAIWTISVATELFIKHLTDSAFAKARLEKKKTITYKELALAVESQNEFFFLQDVIPQPITLAKAIEKRQEIEERNRLREAGMLDDDEEGGPDAAPLLNQAVGDETGDTQAGKGNLAGEEEGMDEEGDVAMDGDPPTALVNGTASNGHGEDMDVEEDL